MAHGDRIREVRRQQDQLRHDRGEPPIAVRLRADHPLDEAVVAAEDEVDAEAVEHLGHDLRGPRPQSLIDRVGAVIAGGVPAGGTDVVVGGGGRVATMGLGAQEAVQDGVESILRRPLDPAQEGVAPGDPLEQFAGVIPGGELARERRIHDFAHRGGHDHLRARIRRGRR